jgi:hypothetical protein
MLVIFLATGFKSSKKFHRIDEEVRMHNRRFGNMTGRPIYAQLFVRYSASVPADE